MDAVLLPSLFQHRQMQRGVNNVSANLATVEEMRRAIVNSATRTELDSRPMHVKIVVI